MIHLKRQSGYTIAELLVTIAAIALTTGMAVFSGVSMYNSGRVSRGVAQVVYPITVTRERAISSSNQWRIRLVSPVGSVATGYAVDACSVAPVQRQVGSDVVPCSSGWTVQGKATPLNGVGVQAMDSAGQPVSELIFDRTGRFYIPDSSGGYQWLDVTLVVCVVNSNQPCAVQGKTVQLTRYSGMISVQ